MYIYKWHEVDQKKYEIFCVHIVCNEIQVKVNLEITTFFFYLRFPYCPNFFWFGVVLEIMISEEIKINQIQDSRFKIFIPHIHNYTEYNQLWNVSHVRSMDSAIMDYKHKENIHKYRLKKKKKKYLLKKKCAIK